MVERDGLPRLRFVGTKLLGRWSSGAVAKGPAASLGRGRRRREIELCIFADAADTGGVRRNLPEDGGVGIAAIESKQQGSLRAAGIQIQGIAELDHLLRGAQTKACGMAVATELCENRGGRFGFGLRLGRGWSMEERDGDQAEGAIFAGHRGRDLEEALGANEVGLEAWTEWIATPGDTGNVETSATEEGVIDDGAKRGTGRQLFDDRTADDGKDVGNGNALLGEESVGSAPIQKLGSGGSE